VRRGLNSLGDRPRRAGQGNQASARGGGSDSTSSPVGIRAGLGMTRGPHLSSTAGAGGGGAGWRRRLAGSAGPGARLGREAWDAGLLRGRSGPRPASGCGLN
jgi:hypothetical protein